MKWLARMWHYLVGSPEECGCVNDPEVLKKVQYMVKRAYVFGIITGFLLFVLVYVRGQ